MGEVRAWVLAHLEQKIAECREVATHAPGEWRWEDVDTDLPTLPEGEHWRLSLRTVEEFRETTVGPLPEFILYMVEFDGAQDKAREYAAHLAAHDATRMLAVYEWMHVEAKRHGAEESEQMPGTYACFGGCAAVRRLTTAGECQFLVGLATALGYRAEG